MEPYRRWRVASFALSVVLGAAVTAAAALFLLVAVLGMFVPLRG